MAALRVNESSPRDVRIILLFERELMSRSCKNESSTFRKGSLSSKKNSMANSHKN